MIWKVKAVEARPTDDENEYEFDAPRTHGYTQILDFSPPLELPDGTEVTPAVVVYAFPDRVSIEPTSAAQGAPTLGD